VPSSKIQRPVLPPLTPFAKWRLRAKVGTHKQWHDLVEEQDAEEHGPPLPPEPSP